MLNVPHFPTQLHQVAAELIRDYFIQIPYVDTFLVVNSCARGKAVPESDLDFAVLVRPDTDPIKIKEIEVNWIKYSSENGIITQYKNAHPFAQLHLDIIDGNYIPEPIELGTSPDFFELEIGNQIFYSAPMDKAGPYFIKLQNIYLPYYNENLRLERFTMIKRACEYDLKHIPVYMERELYFQAFDILIKAFQKFLQLIFIANKKYPIAYNKWIKEQVSDHLQKPELYHKLTRILSVSNIESNEINEKANLLYELLNDVSFCPL
ncbi:MAG: hypothetical protein WBP08_13550 [Saprospiraceae bacterium]